LKYLNGESILPEELLVRIQQYIQGELVYVPVKKDKRLSWGQKNGTREMIESRNKEIYALYKKGVGIDRLMAIYHLSAESIRKIIYKKRVCDRDSLC
jgi:Mor family transcriptional regulator